MANYTYTDYITVDTESNKDGSLYLITLYNEAKGVEEVFYNLDQYYKYIKQYKNALIYVHNFGEWDCYFLIEEESLTKYNYKVENIINKNKKLLQITLSSGKHKITYTDTLPRTMISLKKFAESIGEPYNDEIIDFDVYREPNKPKTWKDLDKVLYYGIKDVKILAKLVALFKQTYAHFDDSLSAGTMVWKEVIDEYDNSTSKNSLSSRTAYKNFRKHIVELPLALDKLIRPSFMGGITTPFWHAGILLDKNSLPALYPTMKSPKIYADDISSAYAWAQIRELPNGNYVVLRKQNIETIYNNINNINTTMFFTIKYSYTSAKFPLIPKLHMNEVDPYKVSNGLEKEFEYNTKSDYMHTMLNGSTGYAAISSLDLRIALREECYENFNFEIVPFPGQLTDDITAILFHLKENKAIQNITHKYYNLKNAAPTKALRTAYKSPLVNIYGKTGERPYTEDVLLNIFTHETTKEEKEEVELPRYGNVAVAATITSYVHHNLYFKAKQVGFNNILYCDTDSMFYVAEEKPTEEKEELGVWNNEVDNPARALFICPKKYIIEDAAKKLVKKASAGMDRNQTYTINNVTNDLYTIDSWLGGTRYFVNTVKQVVSKGIILKRTVADMNNSYMQTYYPTFK